MDGSIRRNWGILLGSILCVAIWSCTTRLPPSEPVAKPPAAPVTQVPPAAKRSPATKRFFDAQAVLRQQLARGGTFYGWTVSDEGPACTDESFLDPTPNSVAVRFPPGARMYLHSGSFLGTGLAGQFNEFHGYSAVSVLDRGHELFFSLEDCRRHGMRYAPRPDDSPPKWLTNIGRHWQLPDGWHAELAHPRDFVTLSRRGVELDYQLRFYFNAGLVYLRGPLAPGAGPEPHPVAHGMYKLTEGLDYFEVGGWRFCSAALEDAASARCLKNAPARIGPPLYPIDVANSPVVDFAEQFWKHSAPLYVPMLDLYGVGCQELTRQTSSTGPPSYRVQSEGLEMNIALVRTPAGFDPFLAPTTPGRMLHTKLSGSEPKFVVHGSDNEAFFLNGSPWFFRQEICRSQSKPVNFGLSERAQPSSTAPPTPENQPIILRSEYYMLEYDNPAEVCLRTTLTPLVAPMGRLVVERPNESIGYNYDYYPVAHAFWLTRIGAYPIGSSDPFADRLLSIGPHYAGMGVSRDIWFGTQAECAVGLKDRARFR